MYVHVLEGFLLKFSLFCPGSSSCLDSSVMQLEGFGQDQRKCAVCLEIQIVPNKLYFGTETWLPFKKLSEIPMLN